jgi:glyoxylase I family protein
MFSHVALNCLDALATERWYAAAFGFRRARVVELGEGAQIVFLKLGPAYLELFQAAAAQLVPASGDGPQHPGTIRHLAFQVDDVDATLARVPDAAVTMGPLAFDDFIPGWRTVWVSDPDGVVVEISQGYADQEHPPPCPGH